MSPSAATVAVLFSEVRKRRKEKHNGTHDSLRPDQSDTFPEKAKALVEQMRQLALDLPFESVDDQVRHLGPDVCQRPLDDLR